MTFTDWDGKKYLVKVKSYNIFKTISAADTKYHYLCSGLCSQQKKKNGLEYSYLALISYSLVLYLPI